MNIMFLIKYICILISITCFISCKSVGVRLDAKKDIVADSGELTRYELEKAAIQFSSDIKTYFVKNPDSRGVFVASLPSKNETSDMLPTTVFDQTLTRELLKNGIYTVKVNNREDALKEFQFNQSGMAGNTLSIGKLKSPNYFIKTDITENLYRSGGSKIAEQSINLEVIDLETLVVKWADTATYRKKAASNSSVGW